MGTFKGKIEPSRKPEKSRWWQLKYFFNFHPENWGRWTHFDEHIFQMGWNHQLEVTCKPFFGDSPPSNFCCGSGFFYACLRFPHIRWHCRSFLGWAISGESWHEHIWTLSHPRRKSRIVKLMDLPLNTTLQPVHIFENGATRKTTYLEVGWHQIWKLDSTKFGSWIAPNLEVG